MAPGPTKSPADSSDIIKARSSHVRVLLGLAPYVWPEGRQDLRVRVVAAFDHAGAGQAHHGGRSHSLQGGDRLADSQAVQA